MVTRSRGRLPGSGGGPSATAAGESTQKLPGLLVAAVAVAVVVAVGWWLLPDEAVLAPWWTQVLGWPTILLVRSDPVQRVLGGGRLDNRVWLRVAVGGALFAAVLAPTGMALLFPLYAVLVASVHLQWTGPTAWRAGVTVTVLLSALLQLLIVQGLVPTLLPGTTGVMVMGTAVVASVATTVNIALLATEREAGAAALERERRAHHAELLHAATHDALTGQLNRTGLQQAFDALVRDPGTDPAAELAVLYVDLDRFKAVNDDHGHAAGDRLLDLASRRLNAHLRPGDRVARLGGDEFAVLVAGTERTVVDALARRAAAALEEPFDLGCAVVRISASIGVAHRDDVGDGHGPASLERLLDAADGDMYRVKARRREDGGLPAAP